MPTCLFPCFSAIQTLPALLRRRRWNREDRERKLGRWVVEKKNNGGGWWGGVAWHGMAWHGGEMYAYLFCKDCKHCGVFFWVWYVVEGGLLACSPFLFFVSPAVPGDNDSLPLSHVNTGKRKDHTHTRSLSARWIGGGGREGGRAVATRGTETVEEKWQRERERAREKARRERVTCRPGVRTSVHYGVEAVCGVPATTTRFLRSLLFSLTRSLLLLLVLILSWCPSGEYFVVPGDSRGVCDGRKGCICQSQRSVALGNSREGEGTRKEAGVGWVVLVCVCVCVLCVVLRQEK